MTYPAPVIEEIISGNQASDATSHSVVMPTTVDPGDVILILMSIDGGPTVTWDDATVGPWRLIQTVNGSGTTVTWRVAFRICDGTEGGAALSIGTSAAEQSAYVLYRISGANGDYVIVQSSATPSSSPNPAAVNVPWLGETNLFIVADLSDNGTTTLTALPSGYVNAQVSQTGTSTGATVFSGERTAATDLEDPGAWSVGSSLKSVLTVAIRPGSLAEGATTPVIASVTPYTPSQATTHNVDMPAVVAAGDLLVMEVASNVAITSGPSGWTQIFSVIPASSVTGACYVKVADGSEAGGTVAITLASNNFLVARVLRIQGASGNVEGAATSGSSNDPPSVDPSWGEKDTLWIAPHMNFNVATFQAPWNYVAGTQTTGGSGGSVGVVEAQRRVVIDNDNPQPWTVLSGTSFNVSGLIAIEPSGFIPPAPTPGLLTAPRAARLAQLAPEAWTPRFRRLFAAPDGGVAPPADDGVITIIW